MAFIVSSMCVILFSFQCFKTYFRDRFIQFLNNYDNALWMCIERNDDDKWNMFITPEYLMHASNHIGPLIAGSSTREHK